MKIAALAFLAGKGVHRVLWRGRVEARLSRGFISFIVTVIWLRLLGGLIVTLFPNVMRGTWPF